MLAHPKVSVSAAAASRGQVSMAVTSPTRACGQPNKSLQGSAPNSRARRSLTCFARSGGVADAPTTTPTIEKGVERVNKRPPMYKVLLHNDNYNKREYVVRVLLKVVASMTVDDANVVMQEAHETGVALVVACAQDEAEQYCESLRLNGLTSTLEPGC